MTFPVPLTGWPLSEGGGTNIVIIGGVAEYQGFEVVNPYTTGGYTITPNVAAQEPNLGESWQIEALIYTIACQYKAVIWFDINEDWTKLNEKLLHLKEQKVKIEKILEGPIVNRLATLSTIRSRWEVVVGEAGKSARENAEATINVENTTLEIQGVEAEQKKLQGEAEAVQAEIENTLRERETLGKVQTEEILRDMSIGVRASISTPTGPVSVLSIAPLYRRIANALAGAYEQTTWEGKHVAIRRAIVTEYYTDRADLQNPPTVRPVQQLTGSVQFITGLRAGTTFAELVSTPTIEDLLIAIPQYVLQCSQTGSLAREGNP